MRPSAPGSLLLACSLALAVSWEIKMSDFQEKNVDKLASNGFKCPSCFAVKGRLCEPELKWCAADRTECLEFSGIVNTGFTNMTIELKRCAPADQCTETLTSYMGFPISNKTKICKSAFGNGARVRTTALVFFVLFLGKLLH